jgi:hypothetical protein
MRFFYRLIGLLAVFNTAGAEEPVRFNNDNLKAAVEHELCISDPTPTDMLGLTELRGREADIDDLTGLEYAHNLRELDLAYNKITDLSPLSGLSNLTYLDLNHNTVESLSALSGLTGLEYLNMHVNELTDVSALSSLVNLRTLSIRHNRVSDLPPLSGLSDLEELDARGNKISDLSPLSGLDGLERLILAQNELSDISPLSGLTGLLSLNLEYNQISDISALSSLTHLRELTLLGNTVSDLSPLLALTSLRELNLERNPLNDEDTCGIYVPQIEANNPGIRFTHSAFCNGHLRLSSTAGGSIYCPGEGEFTYKRGETVVIEARPDPGFVFVNFTGSVLTRDNPASITMNSDYQIRANFLSVLAVLHVDDDGPGDPRPGDAGVSDPKENGTAEHPFDRIQEAIEAAADGATVFVHAGTYRETIDLLGKRIQVTGFDPADPGVAAWPVLDGDGKGTVVSFVNREGPVCTLQGLVITGGKDRVAAAVRCKDSSPTLANCIIAGNCASDSSGSIVYCTDSSASFTNCTITDNQAGVFGAALCMENSPATVANSILWNNGWKAILSSGTEKPLIHHSTISGGWLGLGNLQADPLFAAAGQWVNPKDPTTAVGSGYPGALWIMGDYHLQSQAGRWDPDTGTWVRDKVTSPCIDKGDPAIPVGPEPLPSGGIIDMGAYGGTAEASQSVSTSP